jgi:hypothetical protein
MPEGKGYSINAQKPTPGKQTTGGSAVHNRMKPKIMKYDTARDSGAGTDNKKMYKSKTGDMKKGKMSY